MCIHFGLGGLVTSQQGYVQTPSTQTRRVARGIFKAKDQGAFISVVGRVRINLHVMEQICVSCTYAPDGAWCRLLSECDRHCTHGMGMHVCSVLQHTCGFARVMWSAVLDVLTRVGYTCRCARQCGGTCGCIRFSSALHVCVCVCRRCQIARQYF